jgi:predicted membrane-bound spermidine synthase
VLASQFALGFALMIGPTLLVGTTFPLAIAALRPSTAAVGRDVGRVYGANTVGTILGSMLAGFVLIPALGIQGTVRVAATANVARGSPRSRWLPRWGAVHGSLPLRRSARSQSLQSRCRDGTRAS